jgi:hypothetical protein
VQRILQSQDGVADVELSSASQDGLASQQALAFAPAQQTRLLNRSGWLGVEPPLAAQPVAAPPLEPPAGAAPSVSGTALPDLPAGPAGFIAGSLLLGSGTANAPLMIQWQWRLPRLHGPSSEAPGHTAVSAGVTAGEAGAAGGAASALPAGGAAGTSSPRQGGGSGPGGGAGGDAGALLLLSPGAAGPAPHGGAGAFGLAGRAFKLVAPAHLGPLSAAPALGRSVVFSEPIERPG